MSTPDTSSDEVLAAAEALANAATPGPWHTDYESENEYVSTAEREVARTYKHEANHAFIAASRELVPTLVAIARRLQGELAETRTKRAHAVDLAAHNIEERATERARAEKAEAEVRELRATIARVAEQLRGIAPIIRIYRSPAKYDHAHVNRVLEAVIADATTGDKT